MKESIKSENDAVEYLLVDIKNLQAKVNEAEMEKKQLQDQLGTARETKAEIDNERRDDGEINCMKKEINRMNVRTCGIQSRVGREVYSSE